MNTIKSDIELIERQIEVYEGELGGGDHSCVFCRGVYKSQRCYPCGDCVLVRRFKKECFDYPTFREYTRHGWRDKDKRKKEIHNRIKALKRMIKKLKELNDED